MARQRGAIFIKLGRAPDTMVIFIADINWRDKNTLS
jgi:hypothetical protein